MRPAAIAVAVALAWPALAEEFGATGDGSDSSNPELMVEDAACPDCLAAPHESWADPPFVFDWSLGLRGGMTTGTAGSEWQGIALPSVSLSQQTLRGGYDAGLDGEVTLSEDGDLRVNALGVTAGANYMIDEATEAAGRIDLDLSQDAPDGDDQPADVKTAPLEISGEAEASVSRKLGNFEFTLRGSVGRAITGETTFNDNTTADNSYENTTSHGAGGRIGVGLTPNLQAYLDAEAIEEAYDAPSPSLLVKLDNRTYAGRLGLRSVWGEVLEFEGSLGLAYRAFAEPGLDEVVAALYDAQLTFRPNETVTLGAGLTTVLGSPGSSSGASARLEYAATADASYQVNSWLRLRASAGFSYAELIGTPTIETEYSAGAGADYLLNEQMDLTADYGFTRSETTPDPAEDEHRFALGVTFHR